jgi:cytochrome c biogenesis protein CcmG, thiol:disulfide interchange protein DsbE
MENMNQDPAAAAVEATAQINPRPSRRVDRSTLGVLAALALVAAGWLIWSRLTGSPSSGSGWGPLDSVLAASAARQIGKPAPAFTLVDPSGVPYSLADLRGQVVLVNFWATWCAPCHTEMPELDQVARDYREAGFRVLAVNVLEDATAVRRYGEELQLDLPRLLDPGGGVYKAYNVQGLPTSFLVDRDGLIRDVRYGVVSRGYFEARLPTLLEAPEGALTLLLPARPDAG